MRISFCTNVFGFFMALCVWSPSLAQVNVSTCNHAEELHKRTGHIRKLIEDNKDNFKVEYPIQDYYHLPHIPGQLSRFASNPDTTPPGDPSGLTVHTSSIFSVRAEFTAAVDAESGISQYVFGVGTTPGSADIRWWQTMGTSTITPSHSLATLGISEGSVFYITVYAINGAGLQSNYVSSSPVTMHWEDYGDTSNTLTVLYANYGYDTDGTTVIAGWTQQQINLYEHFISRMLPIIKEIYGPPSTDNTITLVRNLYYSGSNIFFPGTNQIHKDDSFHPQLLTHELLHAFRDDVILSIDASRNYHPKLSGFEEGFAQGVSYACMNRYVQVYPNDTVISSSSLFGSSMDWDYDFKNVSNITTEDFWSDHSGMSIFWDRYELGAAAMRKIQLEDSNIFRKFNMAYYDYLNNNHDSTPSRKMVVDIFSSLIPEVEGIPTEQWLNKQRIFDCRIQPGKKNWVRTQHYPWMEYIIFHTIYHYETFSNGSDWAYYDNNSNQWVYHSLNGRPGTGTVKNWNDSVVWHRNMAISQNPTGFGYELAHFSTDNDLSPWPGGDTSDFVLNLDECGLYKFELTFDTTSITLYRVIGDQLGNPRGVFGGLLNANGGVIYIDHEHYQPEPAIPIINGAFHAERSWASVPNPQTGGTDTRPGRVTFRYIDAVGNEYRAYRNIDWGSASGNQAFLLDVNEMEYIVPQSRVETAHKERLSVAPNPGTGIFRLNEDSVVPECVNVYDMFGKVVWKKKETTTIDLTGYPKGSYVFESVQKGISRRGILILN